MQQPYVFRTAHSAMLLALLGALATAYLLAACSEPEPKIGLRRAPSAVAPDHLKIKEVCDFFAYRAVDTLGTAEAQGNAALLADRPGVPEAVHDATHDYYADGITWPDTADHRTTLELRYTTVMRACRGAGWVRP